jgi:hypothetical protein
MQDKAGISFSETMAGGVSLGETDFHTGEEVARNNGAQTLVMNARVTIDDLEPFINNAGHTGLLDGTIDYPPFAKGIPGYNGVFNLFAPAEQPNTKLMIYEMVFEHENQPYYLAGRKEVRDDPGFDLWSDTTTLYTHIHRGKNKSGEIVGAGILTLGIGDLIRLLSTLEVLHTTDRSKRLGAMARFGRFFMGELWDSYAALAK